MLTQEEAARLQMEVGALQQQLSTERNLVVEAQVTLTTTQVLRLPTLRSHVYSNMYFCCLHCVCVPFCFHSYKTGSVVCSLPAPNICLLLHSHAI